MDLVNTKLDKLSDQISLLREQNARLENMLQNSIKQFDAHLEESEEGWKKLEALEMQQANWKGTLMGFSVVMGAAAVVVDYCMRIWLKV